MPAIAVAQGRDDFGAQVQALTMGDVAEDLSLFMGAVIDARAFAKHTAALERARNTPSIEILAGGTADDSEGFFVRPTILHSRRPDRRDLHHRVLRPDPGRARLRRTPRTSKH